MLSALRGGTDRRGFLICDRPTSVQARRTANETARYSWHEVIMGATSGSIARLSVRHAIAHSCREPYKLTAHLTTTCHQQLKGLPTAISGTIWYFIFQAGG